MDIEKLTKADLEKILGDVIDATVDELAKSEFSAVGPSQKDPGTPGFAADEATLDKVAASEGVAVKAEEKVDEDEDEEEEKEEKSNTATATLLKSQLKSMLSLSKAMESLNDKVERLSKGRARDRKSAISEEDVTVVEKSKAASDTESLIKSNPFAFAKGLLALQKDGKIPGKMVTEFELYGAVKVPEDVRKSALQTANLIK